MVETDIFDCMSPNYDLDLEDSKPISSHNTLAHNATPYPRLVTKGSTVQKISSGKTLIDILDL